MWCPTERVGTTSDTMMGKRLENAVGGGLGFTTEGIWKRARERERQGDHLGAARQYRIVADIDPSDDRAGLKLAHNLVCAGRYREATDEYLRLAVVYAEGGRDRRALTLANQAMRLGPSRVTPKRLEPLVRILGRKAERLCTEAARMHQLAGRTAEATELQRLLVEHDPGSISKRMRLAELSLAEGRTDEGLAELRIVAEGLYAHGRTGEFVRIGEMMLANGSQDVWAVRELAKYYLRSGDLERAIAKLQLLARLVPDDEFALERLIWARAKAGDTSHAIEYLVQLVSAMAASRDRGELRALFVRAEAWSEDEAYQRELEMLRVTTLCNGSMPTTDRRSRGVPPPPPPSRRPYRGITASMIPLREDITLTELTSPVSG